MAINDTLCPFCGYSEENEAHVFLTCDRILPLWWESMTWVNIHGAFREKPWQHFSQHAFCNETFDGNKLMEDAIFTLWTWLKNFDKDFAFTYSYWSSNIASGFALADKKNVGGKISTAEGFLFPYNNCGRPQMLLNPF